jgi:hypothetical protein
MLRDEAPLQAFDHLSAQTWQKGALPPQFARAIHALPRLSRPEEVLGQI